MVIAFVLTIVTFAYLAIYGKDGATLMRNKDDKALSYTLSNVNAKRGCAVFLGDSITEMCKLDECYPAVDSHNRGISGDTTAGMLNRLQSNVLAINPSMLVVLGGTNDLDRNISPKDVADNIQKIILSTRQALPDCKIIIQSIYPVNSKRKPSFLNKVHSRTNENINAANALIKGVCEDYCCLYVDVNTHLKDGSGNLESSYSQDGLHLTKSGYAKVASILTPYIS